LGRPSSGHNFLNINKLVEGSARLPSFSQHLKSNLRKQNEISEPKHKREVAPMVAHKNNSENLWVETIFWCTKTSESGQKPSEILFFLFERNLYFRACFSTELCVRQYLLPPKFEEKTTLSILVLCGCTKQNKTSWLFWRISQRWTKCLYKVFFLALCKKKTKDWFEKRIKNMSINKQTNSLVYSQVNFFFSSPSFFSCKKKQNVGPEFEKKIPLNCVCFTVNPFETSSKVWGFSF